LILQQRADIAFHNDTVSIAAINVCAALAGSEHGDARRAVDLLRVSAEIAEREGANKLDEKHVRIAVQKIERDRIYDGLGSLPLQAKIILLSVLYCEDKCSSGELFNKYLETCKKIRIEPLTQRRVSSLLSELDLLGLINTNLISKGRYGRTKKIKSSIPIQLIREVFIEDPVLSLLF
jgi:cell division control protein 6